MWRVYMCTKRYIKKNKILLFTETWMELKLFLLSKTIQTQKDKFCIIISHVKTRFNNKKELT